MTDLLVSSHHATTGGCATTLLWPGSTSANLPLAAFIRA
jgi:hypothetical protein